MYLTIRYFLLVVFCFSVTSYSAEIMDRDKAEQTLRKALATMQTLRHNGGWAMRWSSDLKMTWGEHAIRPADVITVQPPATPGVAGVYLRAYQILGDPAYLEIAEEAGDALIRGQLKEGGFPHEFSPGKKWEKSGSFDDNVTQGATRYLLALWKTSKEQKFLKAVRRCAQFMLDSQYENGGWPQAFPLRKGYSRYITLNDDAMMDVIRTLFLLYHEFGDKRYYDAAVRGGDCLLALQGKPPQAGWAQQYTSEGEPAPARRFEPVALSSSESVGVLRVLMEVYEETGDKKYLRAGPPAFEWFRKSQLPNGKWARFYRYGDNQDLYCTESGEIIYDVSKARPGYSWQGNYFPNQFPRMYERLLKEEFPKKKVEAASLSETEAEKEIPRLAQRIEPIIRALDDRGYWLTPMNGPHTNQYRERIGDPQGVKEISTSAFVFSANRILDYLERAKK